MLNKDYIHTIVSLALKEDIGPNQDITSNALVTPSSISRAVIIAKNSGIICGLELAKVVFKTLSSKINFKALVKDGDEVKAGQTIVHLKGSTRALLTGERVALNFISYLSGIATTTHAYVQAIKPFKSKILDTRKTTPTLRELERYAVRCGGGVNHRYDLSSMAMIKDNHRVVAFKEKSLPDMVMTIKKKFNKVVILEVDSIKELKEALNSSAEIILLDNFTVFQTKKAIALRAQLKKKVQFESSGGINLKNVLSYAQTGVERISIGSLTHTRTALDVSLDFCS